jgi:hypothetical protein
MRKARHPVAGAITAAGRGSLQRSGVSGRDWRQSQAHALRRVVFRVAFRFHATAEAATGAGVSPINRDLRAHRCSISFYSRVSDRPERATALVAKHASRRSAGALQLGDCKSPPRARHRIGSARVAGRSGCRAIMTLAGTPVRGAVSFSGLSTSACRTAASREPADDPLDGMIA